MTFLVLRSRTGVQTLGWSMGAMSVLTCTWMLVGMRRSGGWGAWPMELAARPVQPFRLALAVDGSEAAPAAGLERLARGVRELAGNCGAGAGCLDVCMAAKATAEQRLPAAGGERRPIRAALTISTSLGGQNAALVLGKVEG